MLAAWGRGLAFCSACDAVKGFSGPMPSFVAFFSTLIQLDGDTLCFSFCPKDTWTPLDWVQAALLLSGACQVIFNESV